MAEEPIPIKLVVVGDGAVGKTCLLISYSKDEFPTIYVPTVFDNYTTKLNVEGRVVNLGLWDTAGQEGYKRLRPLAYHNCDVFLIVFSVVQPSSFVNARKNWFPQLSQNASNVPKIFVGNKIDLRQQSYKKGMDPRQIPISKKTAQKFIEQQLGCRYMQCSALTQQGLKEVFDEAVKIAMQKKKKLMIRKRKKSFHLCQLI